MLVDIHCHLDHERFSKDLDQVIERAKKVGMSCIITAGVNKSSNRKALEIAKKYDVVKPSLGLYPLDALASELKGEAAGFVRDVEPLDVDSELEFIESKKDSIIAIGEAGMDFNWGRESAKEQEKNFLKVISLAERINKPLIVHTRKAEKECIDLLESSKLKKVNLHCFGGRKSLVKRAEDLGYMFSIPAVITRLVHFQELVKRVNLKQLLTETDAPYLAPVVGLRCEPMHVKETIKKIADIKEIDKEETEKIIYMNFQKFF